MNTAENLEEGREPWMYAAVGSKGVGKTHRTKLICKAYAKGLGVGPARKVLYFDVNEEYSEVRRISIDDIYKFSDPTYKVEERRIGAFKENGAAFTIEELIIVLDLILDQFRGGLLVVEDVKKYLSHNVNKDIYGKFCTTRHRDCDIIMHLQGIGVLGNPGLFSNIDIVRLHKYSGSVKNYKKVFDDYYEILQIAENIVNKRYDDTLGLIRNGKIKPKTTEEKIAKSFCVLVNKGDYQITGDFTKEEFIEGVYEYVQENESPTIGKLLRKKDRKTGELLYDYNSAFEKYVSDAISKYYGNTE